MPKSIVKATKEKKSEDWAATIRYKSTTFISLSAKRFDCSILLYVMCVKKYLTLPNQLHFWTGHIQSIVKVKNKLKSRQQWQNKMVVSFFFNEWFDFKVFSD